MGVTFVLSKHITSPQILCHNTDKYVSSPIQVPLPTVWQTQAARRWAERGGPGGLLDHGGVAATGQRCLPGHAPVRPVHGLHPPPAPLPLPLREQVLQTVPQLRLHPADLPQPWGGGGHVRGSPLSRPCSRPLSQPRGGGWPVGVRLRAVRPGGGTADFAAGRPGVVGETVPAACVRVPLLGLLRGVPPILGLPGRSGHEREERAENSQLCALRGAGLAFRIRRPAFPLRSLTLPLALRCSQFALWCPPLAGDVLQLTELSLLPRPPVRLADTVRRCFGALQIRAVVALWSGSATARQSAAVPGDSLTVRLLLLLPAQHVPEAEPLCVAWEREHVPCLCQPSRAWLCLGQLSEVVSQSQPQPLTDSSRHDQAECRGHHPDWRALLHTREFACGLYVVKVLISKQRVKELINKLGVSLCLKDVTWMQQQKPESLIVTLICHVSKSKVQMCTKNTFSKVLMLCFGVGDLKCWGAWTGCVWAKEILLHGCQEERYVARGSVLWLSSFYF